ncbi:cellulose biosynthesis cyclic di-GMP-binding regulatory protein BcsB [Crassaminicella profunda]|uniref:cellulose biosynthesis cyclic di-GMP-binding regulatory protein BcsB n=1 Tax=Crassaminicella profunda TaxID=1286698 RepID=UPI001CA60182|nr:cellulose biosynthesis cyclic di-GMP-binding regulatory protein BcsB [Crassaminicella profunda]QZY53795.1 cellulose biosynthesis cyclic di-GMP-binding regulatory protein BcsB [Crassaminicella profunda]
MIKKRIMVVFIICLFMSTVIVNSETKEKVYIKNYQFNQDIEVKGILGGYTFFFYVDKYWEIQKNVYLELIFSQSDIKEYKHSTLNIYLNDTPIKSVSLFDKKANREVIRIKLPAEKIKNDYNAVKIKTYHRITDEPCADDINPANWLLLHKDSHVHINYKEKKDPSGLKEYPYPYFIEGADEPIKAIITVPSQQTQNEMTSAMKLAADFGRRVPFKNLDIKMIPFNELSEKDKKTHHLICISHKLNLPKDFLPYISDDENLKDKVMMKEVVSPYNKNKRLLLILSDDEDKLIKAVEILGEERLVLQMKKNIQYITDRDEKPQTDRRDDGKITMKDLGYMDHTIEGILYQQANYGVNIPKGRRIKEDAFVNIHMRYSKILNFNRSSVAIYLNDIPIEDKPLSYERAKDDYLSIKIPKELRNNSYLELKVVFYLEPKEFDCNRQRNSNIWAVVLKDSNFDLPYEFTNERYFENYPSPFIREGKFNDLLVVLPENINTQELSMAGNMIAFMAHNIKGLEDLKVIKPHEFTKEDEQKNIILLGSPKENKLIAKINENLHIQFDDELNQLMANKKIGLLEDFNKDAATIQIIQSPWNEKKSVMLVSGAKEYSIEWVEDFLKDPIFVSKLKGDAVVIDENKNLYSVYYVDKKKKEELKTEKKDTERKIEPTQVYPLVILSISLGVMLIIGIIIIMKRNK